jgi:tetratricopeptide (TPR) repeat protein
VSALEGNFARALEILQAGVAEDLASGDEESAAAKLTSMAHYELARGRPNAAAETVAAALQHSRSTRTRYLAARTLVETDDVAMAQTLLDELAREPNDEPRAYAKIVAGLIALKRADPQAAAAALQDANKTFDTWLGLFDLGRALLEVGLAAQASSAFEACLKARRGEALALFVDEQPTYAYVAQLHYFAARAKQSMGDPSFAESYRQYLDLRGGSTEDPLLADVRRLAGQRDAR